MAGRDTFWLVWCPMGTTPPRHRHPSRREALAEASRLARMHRGDEFFVLRAESRARVVDVEVLELDDPGEVPF